MFKKRVTAFFLTFLIVSALGQDAEETEISENVSNGEAQPLGGGPIRINIQPVDAEEYSCEGKADGARVEASPTDCKFFYLCVNGSTHKVECPNLSHQLYFNPAVKSCGDVSETHCKDLDVEVLLEEQEKADAEAASKKDSAPADEVDIEDEKEEEEDYFEFEDMADERVEL